MSSFIRRALNARTDTHRSPPSHPAVALLSLRPYTQLSTRTRVCRCSHVCKREDSSRLVDSWSHNRRTAFGRGTTRHPFRAGARPLLSPSIAGLITNPGDTVPAKVFILLRLSLVVWKVLVQYSSNHDGRHASKRRHVSCGRNTC